MKTVNTPCNLVTSPNTLQITHGRNWRCLRWFVQGLLNTLFAPLWLAIRCCKYLSNTSPPPPKYFYTIMRMLLSQGSPGPHNNLWKQMLQWNRLLPTVQVSRIAAKKYGRGKICFQLTIDELFVKWQSKS